VLPLRLPSATAILFVLHLLENGADNIGGRLSMFGNRARLPHFSEVYEAAHGSVLSRNNCLLLYRTFALAIGSSMASRIGQSARPALSERSAHRLQC
jgi:hypothetical protein